jgi:hypothetical protein
MNRSLTVPTRDKTSWRTCSGKADMSPAARARVRAASSSSLCSNRVPPPCLESLPLSLCYGEKEETALRWVYISSLNQSRLIMAGGISRFIEIDSI